MAATGLKVASGAVAVGDTATGAGIGIAKGATTLGIGVARFATAFGLGVARAAVQGTGAVLGAAGAESSANALSRADSALQGAHTVTSGALVGACDIANSSMSRARNASGGAMTGVRESMDGLAEDPTKLYLRLALGSDTTDMVYGVSDFVSEFSKPLTQVPKLQLYYAAQAWAAIQRAAAAEAEAPAGATHVLPADIDRWVRYSIAAYGASKVGTMLDDPGAEARELRAERQAVLGRFKSQRKASAPPADGHIQASACDGAEDSEGESEEDSDETDSATETPHHGAADVDGVGEGPAETAEGKSRLEARRNAKKARRLANQQRKLEAAALKRDRAAALKELAEDQNSVPGKVARALTVAGVCTDGIEGLLYEEVKARAAGQPHIPGYFVVVDHTMDRVVIAIRGSAGLKDALLDLDCQPVPVRLGGCDGQAHKGMLEATEALDTTLAPFVEAALAKLDGPQRLLIVGHSLGGGIAALLTARWHDGSRFPDADVRCLAFACPQVLDAKLASAMRGHTTNYVFGDDCVPCFSLATATDLRNALLALADPASQGLPADLAAEQVLARIERGDEAGLAAAYASIRAAAGTSPGRLFPAGCLVKLAPGQAPREFGPAAVDEMVVTADMVRHHFPRHYVAGIEEAVDAASERAACVADVGMPQSAL